MSDVAPALPASPVRPDACAHPALAGLTVLERGWLSSNNILVHAAGNEPGAWLIDTGHASHATQTVALVKHALAGQSLAGMVNTHLHNDHCGGNAAMQRAFGLRACVPHTLLDAVSDWDAERLGFEAIGHQCPRFEAGGSLAAGAELHAGGRRWQALAAPGHDPDSLMLFDAESGVLISADALWEDGFGLVFPELIGEPGFDDVAATLDLIESLPVQCVIPGHGAPFTDVAGALARSRSKLAYFRSEPERHARHALKALLKFRLMELRQQTMAELLTWTESAPLLRQVLQVGASRRGMTASGWCEDLVRALAAAGLLQLQQDLVRDITAPSSVSVLPSGKDR